MHKGLYVRIAIHALTVTNVHLVLLKIKEVKHHLTTGIIMHCQKENFNLFFFFSAKTVFVTYFLLLNIHIFRVFLPLYRRKRNAVANVDIPYRETFLWMVYLVSYITYKLTIQVALTLVVHRSS